MRIIGNLLWWLFGGLEACDTDIQDWSALPMAFWF